MPRAKVRDQDRQRVRKACVPCKQSKIRCDADTPCLNCIRRKCRSSCQYVNSGSRQAHCRKELNILPQPEPQSSHGSRQHRSQGSSNNDEDQAGQSAPHNDATPAKKVSSRPSQVTHSRMLLSSKGEKLYIGKIASLSLLQFLRQTVRIYIGPSTFSDTAAKNVMLEIDTQDSGPTDLGREDTLQKQALIQYFFKASSGLLDMYSEDEVFHILSHSVSSSDSSENQLSADEKAALFLIVAIGGQCRGYQPSDLQYASTFFFQGQKLAFEGMLCDPSIHMIRIFLLLAFYMLGACRRNAAFMYLGVASKAACALGLHSESHYPNLSLSERNLRERTWKSLFVLDTLVNSILGRPSSTPLRKFVQSDRQHRGRFDAMTVAYGACTHIATVVSAVSEGMRDEYAFAEKFLEDLRQWGEGHLPSPGAFMTKSPSEQMKQESMIGKTHVACMYYFTIILVTRPFLLSHLTHKLRKSTSNREKDNSSRDEIDPRISKLAQVCLDAASYMAQLCQKVMLSNELANSMCILKAFMFAAGLLLGFAYFVDGRASEVEDAFRASRAVLQKFSTLSPQARHYGEILQDFEEAIARYQQSLLKKRREATDQYVRRLFPTETESADDSVGERARGPPRGAANEYFTATAVGVQNVSDVSNVNRSNGNHSLDFLNTTEGRMNDVGNSGSGGDDTTGLPSADDLITMPILWDNFELDWQEFGNLPIDMTDDV